VPLRKSFLKNYKTALYHIEDYSNKRIEEFVEHVKSTPVKSHEEDVLANIWKDDAPSISHPDYKKHEKCYDYAYSKTNEELMQGIEGFLHNLNTLQSRAGS